MDSRFPHIPPGRAPGPQSRRERTGNRILLVVLPLFAVGAAVAVVAIGDSAALYVFGPLGLIALASTGWVWARSRPPRPGRATLAARPVEVGRGGEVEAEVRIDAADDGTVFEVGLVCIERYDYERVTHDKNGTHRSRETKEHTAHATWVKLADGPVHRLRLPVPAGAPFSYEGDCLSFAWSVRVRERRPRRRDRGSVAPIWVTP